MCVPSISHFSPPVTSRKFRAADIMLTGRDVDAVEAERIGLVSQAVSSEALIDEAVTVSGVVALIERHRSAA